MERQLALEEEMVTSGIERARAAANSAIESGRGHETPAARRLMKELLVPLAKAIAEHTANTQKRGHGAKIRRMLMANTPEKNAFLTLTLVMSRLQRSDNESQDDLTKWSAHLGRLVEDEVRFTAFHASHTKYVDQILADFKKQGTTHYRHMHRVLTFKANQMNATRIEWSQSERTLVGSTLLRLCAASTKLIDFQLMKKKNKGYWRVMISPDVAAWASDFVDVAGSMAPVFLPCIIQPDSWKGYMDGGYWSPKLRQRVTFVKTHRRAHIRHVEHAPMRLPRAACSAMQNTPWRVNSRVQGVLRDVWQRGLDCGIPSALPVEIPPCPFTRDVNIKELPKEEQERFAEWKASAAEAYTAERERAAKSIQLACTLKLGEKFANEERFYFPFQTDFRGRMYAVTSGLSPQGPNFGKGMIEFANGMPLGTGEKWWFVHGANVLGKDKISYDARAQYMRDNADHWCAVADNPLAHRDVWGCADKPWQFLAWCFEFRDFCHAGDSFHSHIPIALDGSCNGLQHFSAALRDPIGGAATNLVDADVPADIYQRVADVVIRKLMLNDHPLAQAWLDFGIDRKLCKKPVMTMPYGSTRQTCTKSIYGIIQDKFKKDKVQRFPKAFAAAVWLTPILWSAIGEVVVAARAAMDWLRDCGSIVAKANLPITWTSPSGFPVYQENLNVKVDRVETVLMGGISMKLSVAEHTNTMNVNRMRNGISPNFVHSLDASHLVFTVCQAYREGIRDFACIHDDFGTHACLTDDFHRIIRQEFVKMYKDGCPLTAFKEEVEKCSGLELPDVPASGSLDIESVLTSKYFFG